MTVEALPESLFGVLAVVLGEVVAAERGAVARRIGAIVGACQVEALDINGGGGMVPIATVEARLAAAGARRARRPAREQRAMTVTMLLGDALARLRELPADSFDCCVTSPPYWGLRDYGVDGQIGMEPTLAEHLDVMVTLFDEVRRVLKPTGSLWLNYGDCYATAPNGRSAADTKAEGSDDRTFRDKPFSTVGPIGARAEIEKTGRGKYPKAELDRRFGNAPRAPAGGYLKPKDLCMLPNRLAIALQDAGWWVRSEIVWGKPNAMPDSSGNYRPSTAHEKIFLLTKSGDADVWRARDTGELSFAPDLTERCPLVTKPDEMAPRWSRLGSYYDAGAVRLASSQDEVRNGFPGSTGDGVRKRTTKGNTRIKKPTGWALEGHHSAIAHNRGGRAGERHIEAVQPTGRLLRNFEQAGALAELVPPDVMAWEIAIAGFSGAHFATFPPALVVPCLLAGCPPGGSVLDPFGGAGTTGLVADRLGRAATLIELNHDYAVIARDRLRAALARVDVQGGPLAEAALDGLFAAPAQDAA